MVVLIDKFRIVSEANAHEHWRAKWRRSNLQRQVVAAELRMRRDEIPPLPVSVTLTRIAPRALDSDNLPRAFKHVRDAVADLLLPATCGNESRRWADDSDNRIAWVCSQRRGRPNQHAVEIEISKMNRAGVESSDPCEWNPDAGRAAWSGEAHASADVIVGARGQWRLCRQCAELPAFRRYTKRKQITRRTEPCVPCESSTARGADSAPTR